MSTKWALLKAIQGEPDNALSCYAMDDLLEEPGWPELAFCCRLDKSLFFRDRAAQPAHSFLLERCLQPAAQPGAFA
jgi:hypothetical protein